MIAAASSPRTAATSSDSILKQQRMFGGGNITGWKSYKNDTSSNNTTATASRPLLPRKQSAIGTTTTASPNKQQTSTMSSNNGYGHAPAKNIFVNGILSKPMSNTTNVSTILSKPASTTNTLGKTGGHKDSATSPTLRKISLNRIDPEQLSKIQRTNALGKSAAGGPKDSPTSTLRKLSNRTNDPASEQHSIQSTQTSTLRKLSNRIIDPEQLSKIQRSAAAGASRGHSLATSQHQQQYQIEDVSDDPRVCSDFQWFM
jgi:hypothetical protein